MGQFDLHLVFVWSMKYDFYIFRRRREKQKIDSIFMACGNYMKFKFPNP